MSILGKIVNYGFRAVKAAPKLVFGTNSDIVGKAARVAYKGSNGSVFSKLGSAVKAGGKALEKGGTGLAFWKGVGSSIKSLPKFLCRAAKVGAKTAKAAGKSGIWGGIKGFLGGVGKKMPLIGTLIAIGFEIPNIFKAGSEQGAGEALKETGKAAARLAGGAAGAAIGSAICPGIGSLIGWVAGEWLTGLVVGKTYTEKKDELIEQYNLTEEQISQAQEQGYTVDKLLDELKSQGPEVSGNEQGSQNDKQKSEDSASSAAESGASDNKAVSDAAASTSSVTNPSVTTPYPTYTGMTNPFGFGLNVPNPAMIGLNNPFGFGIGSGMYNPVFPMMNQILQPGENIFEKYPLGFRFQYMGN